MQDQRSTNFGGMCRENVVNWILRRAYLFIPLAGFNKTMELSSNKGESEVDLALANCMVLSFYGNRVFIRFSVFLGMELTIHKKGNIFKFL